MTRACLISAVVAILLAAALATAQERLPDGPRLPVLAWGGPPEAQTTPERYRELAEAGFTHNYSGFGSPEGMAKALDVAHAAGVKQMVSLPQLASDPEGTARRFKNHPAVGGYYLRDEPSAKDFPGLATWAKRIQAVDTKHPCYVNLFPNYATAEQLGTATYKEHVDRFVAEVPVPLISFDHYPVIGDVLRPEWYENLEIVSARAREAGKPFWAFALAVAHGPYPVATLPHLRVQVYSNLAYGAQAIQYFTYWTFSSDTWNFHEAPLTTDGKRTPVYERVKEVNGELRGLSGVFVGSKVVSVGHTGKDLPRGTRRYEPAAPVRGLETEGTGAVVSLLANGGRRFLVVVNRDIHKAMPLRISIDPARDPRQVRKDGTLHPMAGAQELAPGDAFIVTWHQAPN
jgi:hypothetical protein